MPDRDPFDELDELLSDAGPTDAVADPAPRQLVTPDRAEPANALAGTPAPPVDDAPALPIKQHAERLSSKLLTALESQFDRGELDADDVMNLLPKVHKVKIDEDKVEIQRGGGHDHLPTINVTIDLSGGIRVERVPNLRASSVEVVEPGPAAEQREATPAWSIEFEPIGAPFGEGVGP